MRKTTSILFLSLVFSFAFSFIFVNFFSSQSSNAGNEKEVIAAVEKANKAVVSVVATKDVPVIEKYYQLYSSSSPYSNRRFLVPRYRQTGTVEREVGGGSGFIVSSDGYIVTNRHVVSDEEAEYTVFLNENQKLKTEVIARDPIIDIAILKIKNSEEKFPYLEFNTSDALQLGQTAIAIGNALGEFRNSISVGVISGLSRNISAKNSKGNAELLAEVIQTDAAINPGNSGGPLLDSQGRVIGVNVAVVQGSENIGFAIPAQLAKSIYELAR